MAIAQPAYLCMYILLTPCAGALCFLAIVALSRKQIILPAIILKRQSR